MENEHWVAFKNLPEPVLPNNLKQKTMRRIIILKLRPLIFTFTALLILNLVLLANHIYARIIASGLLNTESFFRALHALTPTIESVVLTLNTIIVLGAIGFYQHYHHELFKR